MLLSAYPTSYCLLGPDRLGLAQSGLSRSVFICLFLLCKSNFYQNNLPLCSTSPYSSVYHNIDVINNVNIDFIVIVVTWMQSPICNAAGILVFNSDPDYHFCPGRAKQEQNLFWNSLKIKSPQQASLGKLSWNAPSIHTMCTRNR